MQSGSGGRAARAVVAHEHVHFRQKWARLRRNRPSGRMRTSAHSLRPNQRPCRDQVRAYGRTLAHTWRSESAARHLFNQAARALVKTAKAHPRGRTLLKRMGHRKQKNIYCRLRTPCSCSTSPHKDTEVSVQRTRRIITTLFALRNKCLLPRTAKHL